MQKIFKYFFYFIFILLFIVGLYFFIAYVFTFFKKNNSIKTKQENTIYLLYSTVHSDIVFNIKDINLSKFPEFKQKNGYLAFGWGDKETYLNTPNINDIKISTSLKALFINTPSLMHVSYISNVLQYKNVKEIKLSSGQEKHLKASIMQSFKFKEKAHKGYGREDFFYVAKGKYNLINTCNTWTGDQIRESNISMAYWTPFVWSVTNSLN